MVVFYPSFHRPHKCIFFYLGFLSRPFTNHRTEWKGKGTSLTPDYHFHPRHRDLDISRAISTESSSLDIVAVLETGTFGFEAQVANEYLKQGSVV